MSTSYGQVTPELKWHLEQLIDAASESDHLDPVIDALRMRGRWDWAEDLADERADADSRLRQLRERLDAEIADR
ncbi:MAG: hypothetical protein WD206_09950 [Actinomycetota bacterium]